MKINTSSVSTQLYMWFYGISERKLPTNLCPYFWKLVFMSLLIIPYSIFCLPVVIMELVMKILKKEESKNETWERVGYSLVIYIFLIGVSSLIVSVSLFWNTYPIKTSPILNSLSIAGTILWIMGIIVGVYNGIQYLYKSIRNWIYGKTIKYDEDGYRIYPEPKVNIVKEFVKAKYHKYCPQIEWVKDKK
jgi:hypothetical protein